jgi:hypothetical protein
MTEHYFIDDAANYAKSFQQYITNYGSLMRMVESNCFAFQEISGKDLFDATLELMYPVNKLYKKQNSIEGENEETSYVTYVNKNELKTMLAEVVQEYFNGATIKND